MENNENRKWNVDQYLERIGMERPEKPDRAYLDRLVTNHLIHVPFEALDLYAKHAGISQDLEVLFEKVVLNRRGGYCFEQNKLFQFLLKDLGYDTYPCFCRVQRGEETSRGIAHRGNIVYLDGKRYFCDVGFGTPVARGSIEISETHQKIGEVTCWFERYSEGWYDLYRLPEDVTKEDGSVTKGVPMRELRICTARAEEQDFEVFNAITSSPSARFNDVLMVCRLTENGSRSLNEDKIYSIVENNHKTQRQIKDDAELWQILKDDFGLVLK